MSLHTRIGKIVTAALLSFIVLGPVSTQNLLIPTVNTAYAQASATPPAAPAAAPASPPACSSAWFGGAVSPLCWIQTIVVWFASALISIAIVIMTVVGWLFDFAISQTVLGFNDWLSGDVLTAIGTGWTFFRDIANIIIIGLFVFIAISIILGNKSYGQRSLIARVLIVAVLINFSFLFTRIVINFSNAVAVQFAKAQPLGAQATGAGVAPPDIAGKFTDLMGAKTFGQTADTLNIIAKNNNSFWLSLLHALFITVAALGIAIVLLYGSILLIARAVIFIFLLVTSSLAFATYLLPNFASSEFGWKAWWTALFRNAMLAPLMMMFLAVTLKISQGLIATINSNGSNIGQFGALAAHPDDPKTITALAVYVIILGLLYGAIRVSNMFAGAAGQLAWAGTLPFANATTNWPSRGLNFLNRNTVGRGAASLGESLHNRAVQSNIRNPGGAGSIVWDRLSQGVKSVAKRDVIGGNTGNKPTQNRVGGFIGQQNAKNLAREAREKRLTPSQDELKLSKDALKKARDEAVGGGDNRKRGDAYDANQKALEAAKKMEQAAKQQVDAATKSADAITKQVKTLEGKRDAATAENKAEFEKQIKEKGISMVEARNAILNAESSARDQSTRVINLELDGKNLKEMLDKRAAQFMPQGHAYVPEERHETISRRQEENSAQDAMKMFSNTLNRTGSNLSASESFAQSFRMASKQSESGHDERLGRQIERLADSVKQMAEQQHEQTSKTNEYLKEIRNDQRNRRA